MSMVPDAARTLVTGWATAGKAVVAPYLGWIYVVIAVAVLAGAGWSVWRVMSWRTGFLEREAAVSALAAEKRCDAGTACETRAIAAARAGQDAVDKARAAAQEAAQAQQAKLAADGRAAVERAQAAASVAAVRLREAEARLRQSIARDASCAAQAQEVIKCDF